MKKTITLLDEEVTIAFNVATQIAYEEMTDEAFDLKRLDRQRNSLALGMACIIANNPDTTITFDRLAREATSDDMTLLNTAVIESMMKWFHIPEVVEKREKEIMAAANPEGEEEKGKN